MNTDLDKTLITQNTNNAPNVPSDLVIVIGRQFGGGGRRVGHLLASRLGIQYYDKELINEACVHSGIAPDILSRADEKKSFMPGSLLSTFFGLSESYGPDTLSSENLYKLQSSAIRKIGMRESCVLVGRTSDYILRDHPHLLSVFLHSPIEKRAEKIVERGEADSLKQARDKATKADKHRENYYNYFTGRHWGRADNYDLTLNSSSLSDEELVDIIVSFIHRRFK